MKEDGEEGGLSDAGPGGQIPCGGPELRQARDQRAFADDAGEYDKGEAADFDYRHQPCKADGLNGREAGDSSHREHDGSDNPGSWKRDEHSNIARAANCNRGGRNDSGGNDEQSCGAAKPFQTKRRLDIGCFARCDRHSGTQFSKGSRGDPHHDSCSNECHRRMHAASSSGRPDQHIDAGADCHAQPVEHGMGQRERSD
jgi:hypothetical protein